jgi:8-oxo-dGTP pyrophosphatase MutT (NUDIX family)
MEDENSVGAVIFREKEGILYYLLLFESDSKYWGFSKGGPEKGEALEKTVKRELEEETGIKDIELVSGFKEEINYFYKRDGKTIYKTVIFFLAETKTERVELSFEHTDFQWLPYQKALEKLTYDNTREVLKRANEFILRIKG